MTLKLIEAISQRLDEGEEGLEKRFKSFERFTNLPLEPSPLYAKYVDSKLLDIDLSTVKYEVINEQIEWPSPPGFAQILYNGRCLSRRDTNGLKLLTVEDLKRDMDGIHYSLLNAYENKVSALIQALYTSGHVLLVDNNTVIEEPIHLVSLVDRSVISRNLIILGKGAEVKVIEEFYSPHPPKEGAFHAYSNEISLGENSTLQLTTVQAADESVKLFNIRNTDVKRNASLDWTTTYLGGASNLGRVEHRLAEEYASVKDTHVALLTNSQALDLTTDLLHQSPKTNGSIVARVALRDSSKSITKGMIKILAEGKQSNAYLSQHAIMLSPSAAGITIPGLEILTNDVKATHSSSVSQLDEEQIFYMMSRGLDKASAIKMIALGFFEHALDRLYDPRIKEGVKRMLDDKWHGKLVTFKPIEEIEGRVEETKVKDIFEGHYKYR